MNKYVFCDLDNTLLNNDKEISKEDYDAIKNFENKGNHFIICSGRVPFALQPFKDRLSSKDVITSNGSVIISDNKITKKITLSKEIIKTVVNYAIKNKLSLRMFTIDRLLLFNRVYGSIQGFMYKNHLELDENTIFDAIDKEDIIKVIFTSDDGNILQKAKDYILSLNIDVELSFSSKTFLEVNAINQNKGSGIIDFCKLKNINIENTISIGDNDNDLPMLRITHFSACPSNAIDEVKKEVDYVCINDNNHNAIKEVLEKIQ